LRRLRSESGFSLVEMLTVLVIMGVVMGGLTTLLVQGSNAEVDMNNRFQAQLSARLGLDKLRRDLHCAQGPHTGTTPTATSITLDVPCVSGAISWCTSGSGTRYGLYRNVGTTCSSSNTKFIDYLTTGNAFWYDGQWAGSLAKLHVDLKVNVKPTRAVDTYDLCDVIVLRNSSRVASITTAPTRIPNTTPTC
jgi:prepilin-type N-terminal cleavage/methylation domain-containing protein